MTDYKQLWSRLEAIGIREAFIRKNVLPYWWSEQVDKDGAGLAEACGYIYQQLGIPTNRLLDHDDDLSNVFTDKAHAKLMDGWDPVTRDQKDHNLTVTLMYM